MANELTFFESYLFMRDCQSDLKHSFPSIMVHDVEQVRQVSELQIRGITVEIASLLQIWEYNGTTISSFKILAPPGENYGWVPENDLCPFLDSKCSSRLICVPV